MPSFRQVLAGIADAWADAARPTWRSRAVTSPTAIEQAIVGSRADADVRRDRRRRIRRRCVARSTSAGAGSAARRSSRSRWCWSGCLRQRVRGRSRARCEMVDVTLDRMAAGGMHDQVGGGFARYSTDRAWHVPHFEKMLSDNAQLLQLYTDAWLVTARRAIPRRGSPNGGLSAPRDAAARAGASPPRRTRTAKASRGSSSCGAGSELVAAVGEPVAEAFGACPEGNWEGTNVLWIRRH